MHSSSSSASGTPVVRTDGHNDTVGRSLMVTLTLSTLLCFIHTDGFDSTVGFVLVQFIVDGYLTLLTLVSSYCTDGHIDSVGFVVVCCRGPVS
jgi:hypothetical protein